MPTQPSTQRPTSCSLPQKLQHLSTNTCELQLWHTAGPTSHSASVTQVCARAQPSCLLASSSLSRFLCGCSMHGPSSALPTASYESWGAYRSVPAPRPGPLCLAWTLGSCLTIASDHRGRCGHQSWVPVLIWFC